MTGEEIQHTLGRRADRPGPILGIVAEHGDHDAEQHGKANDAKCNDGVARKQRRVDETTDHERDESECTDREADAAAADTNDAEIDAFVFVVVVVVHVARVAAATLESHRWEGRGSNKEKTSIERFIDSFDSFIEIMIMKSTNRL